MTNPLNKVYAVGHLNDGVMTRNETLVYHLIMEAARVTKITIKLRVLAITLARILASVKVSTIPLIGFVWEKRSASSFWCCKILFFFVD